jgi:hypothetical protein
MVLAMNQMFGEQFECINTDYCYICIIMTYVA